MTWDNENMFDYHDYMTKFNGLWSGENEATNVKK